MSAPSGLPMVPMKCTPNRLRNGNSRSGANPNRSLAPTNLSGQSGQPMLPYIVKPVDAIQDSVRKEIGVSDWLLLTQARINAFADATGDRQWIHLDTEMAKRESPFGQTIAHGFLTLSL